MFDTTSNETPPTDRVLTITVSTVQTSRFSPDEKSVKETWRGTATDEEIEDLKKKLQDYAAQHEPDRLIDVPTFKNLAGVSRKYAIPLLEYFDREQLTRRAGDKRLILRPKS